MAYIHKPNPCFLDTLEKHHVAGSTQIYKSNEEYEMIFAKENKFYLADVEICNPNTLIKNILKELSTNAV